MFTRSTISNVLVPLSPFHHELAVQIHLSNLFGNNKIPYDQRVEFTEEHMSEYVSDRVIAFVPIMYMFVCICM